MPGDKKKRTMKSMKTAGLVCLAALALFIAVPGPYAAPAAQGEAKNSPVEMVADTIEYDSVNGIMTAAGNVTITQEKSIITGTRAEYNVKTKEGYITGGVKAVKDDATLIAAEVRSYDSNTRLVAAGDAVLTKGENRVYGPQVDYYIDRQYAIVPSNARLETTDGIMTTDKLEAYLNEDRAVGTGHVHIVSEARQLDATADEAVYYGQPKGDSKIVLSGNARAIQEGNTLTGKTVTIRLDNKVVDAQGRSRLVVTPKK
ncbi:MAG TPA: LptA/OstA family protein [Methylomusa anaerophila]|uniref:LPS-assembly protein LptD n=1 Tax=Methylomusa anaerophila TaxID=1930071 RepID=A0A348AKI1_9FIRM|nr:LptA/OstA family protein [Methylomusa anaerophila]BBB91579.1 LPS-assembly protein LptD [Methylomusa anaerophila]HML89483.1 LptA/OstA family protein [Methylomusa anaerophila]